MGTSRHAARQAMLPYNLYRSRELKLGDLVCAITLAVAIFVHTWRVLPLMCSHGPGNNGTLQSCGARGSGDMCQPLTTGTLGVGYGAHWWHRAACGCAVDTASAVEWGVAVKGDRWMYTYALAGATVVNYAAQVLIAPFAVPLWMQSPAHTAAVGLWALLVALLLVPVPMLEPATAVQPVSSTLGADTCAAAAAAAQSPRAARTTSASQDRHHSPAPVAPAADRAPRQSWRLYGGATRGMRLVWRSPQWYWQVPGARSTIVLLFRLGFAAAKALSCMQRAARPGLQQVNPLVIWPHLMYLWPCWTASAMLLPSPIQLYACIWEWVMALCRAMALQPQLGSQPAALLLHILVSGLLVVAAPLLVAAVFQRSCTARYAVYRAQLTSKPAAETAGKDSCAASSASSNGSSGASCCEQSCPSFEDDVAPASAAAQELFSSNSEAAGTSTVSAATGNRSGSGGSGTPADNKLQDNPSSTHEAKDMCVVLPIAAAAASAPEDCGGKDQQSLSDPGRTDPHSHSVGPSSGLEAAAALFTPSSPSAAAAAAAAVTGSTAAGNKPKDGGAVASGMQQQQQLGPDAATAVAAAASLTQLRNRALLYRSRSRLMAVSIKVHTPHHNVQQLQPLLERCLMEGLQQAAAAPLAPAGLLCASSACFEGCVQLLASVYHMHSPAQPEDTGKACVGRFEAMAPFVVPGAARLLQLLLPALQAIGLRQTGASTAPPPVEVAAGGVSPAPPAGYDTGSSGTVPAGNPAGDGRVTQGVQACWMEPPALVADQQQPQELLLVWQPGHGLWPLPHGSRASPGAAPAEASSSSQSPVSQQVEAGNPQDAAPGWRVLVFSGQRVWLDVPVQQHSPIRVSVPSLPVGSYNLALLNAAPTAAAAAAAAAAAGCTPSAPLLLLPLLVLPPAAAGELQQLWQAAYDTLVGGEATYDDGNSSVPAAADAAAGSAGSAAAVGGAPAVLDVDAGAKLTAWQHLMSGLLQDVAAVLSAANAVAAAAAAAGCLEAADTAKGSVLPAAQVPSIPAATWRQAGLAPSGGLSDVDGLVALQHVLDPLLRHLSMHHMWATAAMLVGHLRQSRASLALMGQLQGSLEGDPPSAQHRDGRLQGQRAAQQLGVGWLAAGPAADPGGGGSCYAAAAGDVQGGAGSSPSATPIAASEWQQELGAGWGLCCRQLLLGFRSAGLEAAYVQYMHHHASRLLDVVASVYPLVIIMGHGLLAGLPAAAASLGWSGAAKQHWEELLTVLLWGVFGSLTMVLVVSAKAGAHRWRELAHAAGEWAIGFTTLLMAVRLLSTGDQLLRVMDSSAWGDTLLVLGMGVFKPLSRQVRMQVLLPPLLLEVAAQTRLTLHSLGFQWRFLLLRAVILCSWCSSKASAELTSRRLFLRSLASAHSRTSLASRAAAAASHAASSSCSSGGQP